MTNTWLTRVYVIDRFMDTHGFERSNPKLIEHMIFDSLKEAHEFKATIEMTKNLKVIVKPNKQEN